MNNNSTLRYFNFYKNRYLRNVVKYFLYYLSIVGYDFFYLKLYYIKDHVLIVYFISIQMSPLLVTRDQGGAPLKQISW